MGDDEAMIGESAFRVIGNRYCLRGFTEGLRFPPVRVGPFAQTIAGWWFATIVAMSIRRNVHILLGRGYKTAGPELGQPANLPKLHPPVSLN